MVIMKLWLTGVIIPLLVALAPAANADDDEWWVRDGHSRVRQVHQSANQSSDGPAKPVRPDQHTGSPRTDTPAKPIRPDEHIGSRDPGAPNAPLG